MNSVFDMVKVIDFALQEGKVRSLTGVSNRLTVLCLSVCMSLFRLPFIAMLV